jgi:GTP 3',8-cyclase
VTTAPVPVSLSVRQHAAIASGRVGAMPLEGPLIDRYGRVHNELRISVTDRCNLRCVYCMPEEGVSFLDRREILTFEEIVRVASVARHMGVRSIRITGGEPLLRRHLPTLIAQVSALGFDDVALTTNGTALAKMARILALAGLRRVNVSCDSLRADRFSQIRRRGSLADVLRGMKEAESEGLTPLKVNVVLLRGKNDDEILDFASFARVTGRIVRFIEFMPLDAQGEWNRASVVPGDEVLARISSRWELEPVAAARADSPAEQFRFKDGVGEIGLISSVTRPFCGACNRIRLTADGALRNCLYTNDEHPVRDLLRKGGSDTELSLLLRKAIWDKHPGHGIDDPRFLSPARSMSMIGG